MVPKTVPCISCGFGFTHTDQKKNCLYLTNYNTFSFFTNSFLVGRHVALRASMQRSEDVLQHISTDGHTWFHYEFYEPDLRFCHKGVVPVAERTEGKPQVAFLVSLQEEFIE